MSERELFGLVLLLQLEHAEEVISDAVAQTYDELGAVRLLYLGQPIRYGNELLVRGLGQVVFLELEVRLVSFDVLVAVLH